MCHVSCHVMSFMCDLRHHVHDPVHAAAAVELHRVVRDGAVLGPLQQRHRRLPHTNHRSALCHVTLC